MPTQSALSRSRRRVSRRGQVLIYMTVSMSALVGLGSLAVDWGRVELAKTEMQRAVESAARASALSVQTDTSAARSSAITYASTNTVDGAPLSLQSGDIVFGKWNASTHALDTTGTMFDSIQVTGVRSRARGNAIPLVVGQIIGRQSCDLTYTATVQSKLMIPNGIIGLGSFDAKNNLVVGSYDSSVTTHPTSSSHNKHALLGSNGTITSKNNDTLDGDAILGPIASIGGPTISGSQRRQANALNTPTSPAWSPGTNPGNVPQSYSTSGATLPGGTYWFSSLTVSGTLTFTGNTTIYLNGDATIGGTVSAYNSIPGNLTIYQIGSHTFGDSGGNGMDITATVIAPNSDFSAKNNLVFRGSCLFNSTTVKNNAEFYYDEQAGPYNGGTGYTTTLVQ